MFSESLPWILFNLFVLAALAIDLGVFQRTNHVISFKEALGRSAIWITLALLFCIGVYWTKGHETGLNFLTGYLIELSLSVDNLFVLLSIFAYFSVEKRYVHRVLFWGILGAIVLRAIFIFAGVLLLGAFHWIIYIFGALLLLAAVKMLLGPGEEIHPEKNPVLILFRKIMPVTNEYHGSHFFIKKEGRYWATPLFIVLLMVETTDVIFAIDSVPAILAITTDPFIVYTSNVFAILGLRSMYFALEKLVPMFHYLNYGLAALLAFIGIKMLLADVIHIPIYVALGVIASVLTISIVASLLFPKKN